MNKCFFLQIPTKQRWKKASQTSLLSPKVRMSIIMVVLKHFFSSLSLYAIYFEIPEFFCYFSIFLYKVTKVTFVTLLFFYVIICNLSWNSWVFFVNLQFFYINKVTKVTFVTPFFTFVLISDLSWNFWVFFCVISIFLYKKVTKGTFVTLLFTFLLMCDLSWNFWVFYFCEISIS